MLVMIDMVPVVCVDDVELEQKLLREKKLGTGNDIRITNGMTIKDKAMREAGIIINNIFNELAISIKPGTELKAIDNIAKKLLKDNKAKSGLKLQGFPANVSISINEEVIQGIPDSRVISEGDLMSLDMTLYYKGLFVDKAMSFTINPSHYTKRYLTNAVKKCFDSALTYLDSQIKNTGRTSSWTIGNIIEQQALALGVKPAPKLAGHGIGEEPHMPPIIPNACNKKFDGIIKPGMYIAIEPIVMYTKYPSIEFEEFTVNSNYLSAHWEETIAITKAGAEVIT